MSRMAEGRIVGTQEREICRSYDPGREGTLHPHGGFKQRLEGDDQVSCGAGRWKREGRRFEMTLGEGGAI